MKFIDLNVQYLRIKPAIDSAIQRVLDHNQFIFGPELTELEQRLADYVGVKHCIGVSSGTTALQAALMALKIGPDDEVITTPFNFFATAEIIALLGAKSVYIDINPQTYNMDPQGIEAAITKKTKAIIPVSLYGQPADFDAINTIAGKYNLFVIEDAGQSFGAIYKNRRSCGLSTIGCTSFFPSKPFGCYGDGGACFTNDDNLAKKIRLIINQGQESRYHHVTVGINGRLDTIQAAVLLEKLKILDGELQMRQQVASWYDQAFVDASLIQAPVIEAHNRSAYAQYTIAVDHRDQLQKALTQHSIPTAIHYPKGLHEQPCEQTKQNKHFPETERAARRVLSLPFYPYMERSLVERIVEFVTAECIV